MPCASSSVLDLKKWSVRTTCGRSDGNLRGMRARVAIFAVAAIIALIPAATLAAVPADSLQLNLTCAAPGTTGYLYIQDNPNPALNEFGSFHDLFDNNAAKVQNGTTICVVARANQQAWNEK